MHCEDLASTVPNRTFFISANQWVVYILDDVGVYQTILVIMSYMLVHYFVHGFNV